MYLVISINPNDLRIITRHYSIHSVLIELAFRALRGHTEIAYRPATSEEMSYV